MEPIYVSFNITDVFEVKNTKSILSSQVVLGSGPIPYVTASEGNNSIVGYIECPETLRDKGGCVLIGGKTMALSYQAEDFCSNDSHNLALYPNVKGDLSKSIFLFLIGVLRKGLVWKYSWGNSISSKKITRDSISLPVVPSADPSHVYTPSDIDWGYMERYIAELEEERVAELEEERVAELEAYLQATGLDDCELTDEDEQTLAEEPTFAEFRVGDVLDVSRAKGIPAKKNLAEGDIPYVTRATSNNGYMGTCGNADKVTVGNCITIGGETAVAFYQPDDFVAGNNMTCLRGGGLRQKHYQYLAGILNKQTGNYSYSNARSMQRIKEESLSLPVVPSADLAHVYAPADIDWGYMERYIRATEKLVMADVVAYKDRVITETRRIVCAPASHAAPAEGEAVA